MTIATCFLTTLPEAVVSMAAQIGEPAGSTWRLAVAIVGAVVLVAVVLLRLLRREPSEVSERAAKAEEPADEAIDAASGDESDAGASSSSATGPSMPLPEPGTSDSARLAAVLGGSSGDPSDPALGLAVTAASSFGIKGFTLVAVEGTLTGRQFEVGLEGLNIGRDPRKCQLVYQADTLSRLHARVEPGSEGLVVTNLSTTNRTYLNGEPVSQAVARSGDRIRVSKVIFEVLEGEPLVAVNPNP